MSSAVFGAINLFPSLCHEGFAVVILTLISKGMLFNSGLLNPILPHFPQRRYYAIFLTIYLILLYYIKHMPTPNLQISLNIRFHSMYFKGYDVIFCAEIFIIYLIIKCWFGIKLQITHKLSQSRSATEQTSNMQLLKSDITHSISSNLDMGIEEFRKTSFLYITCPIYIFLLNFKI